MSLGQEPGHPEPSPSMAMGPGPLDLSRPAALPLHYSPSLHTCLREGTQALLRPEKPWGNVHPIHSSPSCSPGVQEAAQAKTEDWETSKSPGPPAFRLGPPVAPGPGMLWPDPWENLLNKYPPSSTPGLNFWTLKAAPSSNPGPEELGFLARLTESTSEGGADDPANRTGAGPEDQPLASRG